MPAVVDRAAFVGARPIWLLDLELAGRTFRLSSEPVVVASDDGALSYDGGLAQVDYEESIDRLDSALSEASASVECFLPIDVAALIGAGHPPAGGAAALAMVTWRGGVVLQTWELRLRVLAGRVQSPRWGDPTRALGWFACTVREEAWDDVATVIPAALRITTTAIAEAQAADVGKAYPYPIGRPGRSEESDGTEIVVDGSPAYVYATDGLGNVNKLLVAAYPVVAANVYIRKNGGTFGNCPISHVTDLLGRIVAVADTSAVVVTRPLDADYWACWGVEDLFPNADGAMRNPWAAGELRGAGDVIRWALSLGHVPIDHGRWAAVSPWLNRFRIATYLNDVEQMPWGFVADDLLPILPVALRRGPDGIYPVLLDLDARRADAVFIITEGPDFRQVGELTEEGDIGDIVNEVSISFAPDGDGEYRRVLTLTATPDPDDADEVADPYAQLSAARYGVVQTSQVSTDVVYEPLTAHLVAAWLLRSRAFLSRSVDYLADVSWGIVQVGDLMQMSHASAGMTGRLGLVIGRRWDGFAWQFRILYDEEAWREPRTP